MKAGLRQQVTEMARWMVPGSLSVQKKISRYRINKIRRLLISEEDIIRGEQSTDEKKKIIEKYKRKIPVWVQSVSDKTDLGIKKIPAYATRTDLDVLRTDIIFCKLAYGFYFDEYVFFDLENKSAKERRKWLSDRDCLIMVVRMNEWKTSPVLNNKALTYQKFQKYFKREAVRLSKRSDYSKYIEFVEKHPMFVKKKVDESCGQSVELVNIAETGKDRKEYFETLISRGEHILEEKILQSQKLSSLNDSSVNTVRCITCRTKSGIEVIYTFMKIGRSGTFVDNGGAGGILVGINRETGVFDTDGFDEKRNQYSQHPDHGVVFKGFALPDWQELLSVCKEMSGQLPQMRFIGWDMAHTDGGWVVVEGNGMTQLIGPQIVYRRGIKEEMEELMTRVDVLV